MNDDTGLWLAEPDHPSLDAPVADRLGDPSLPDRLAWNTFRTLAAWNSDVWVPRLLDVALGDPNPVSGLEWGEATVDVWRSGVHFDDGVDVLLDGREAIVLVEATFRTDLSAEHLGAGADLALGLPRRDARQGAFVLVTPGVDTATADRVDDAMAAELLDLPPGEGHGLRAEAVEHVTGWITWADLAALGLDLAEEADPLRIEMVHRMVSDLQSRFPGLEA